jgi:uncharacterized membrane protein YvbJ
MFCPKCGTKIEDSISFCPNCGANVNEFKNNMTQPVVQQPAEPVMNNSNVNNISVSPVVNPEPVVTNENNVSVINQNVENKPNKSKRDLLIILGIVGVIVIAVVLICAVGIWLYPAFSQTGGVAKISQNDAIQLIPLEDSREITLENATVKVDNGAISIVDATRYCDGEP